MCEGGHAAEGLQAGLCPEPAWAQPSGELQVHRMASRGRQQAVPPVMLIPAPGKAAQQWPLRVSELLSSPNPREGPLLPSPHLGCYCGYRCSGLPSL